MANWRRKTRSPSRGGRNEYQLILPFDEAIEEFNRTRNPLVFPNGVPNFGATASIRIGDRAPVIWAGADGPEVRMTPWAWKGPGGRPVFNFRSDGRDFSNSLRCVIPADGFFEFTEPEAGQKQKTKWRFGLAGQTNFWIAGLVKEGAFAMLTTEPGPDIAPYHDRQIVLLPQGEALDWLDLRAGSRWRRSGHRPGRSPPRLGTVDRLSAA
ncbi:SOS response-associated peptidase family protein [Brevundimonas naejangsanensis]